MNSPFVFPVTEFERRRLQDSFRRLSSGPGGTSGTAGTVAKTVFLREVLGSGVPMGLAERIFALAGGGNGTTGTLGVQGQNRGLQYKEVITVLVIITKGTEEEKHKCKRIKAQ